MVILKTRTKIIKQSLLPVIVPAGSVKRAMRHCCFTRERKPVKKSDHNQRIIHVFHKNKV